MYICTIHGWLVPINPDCQPEFGLPFLWNAVASGGEHEIIKKSNVCIEPWTSKISKNIKHKLIWGCVLFCKTGSRWVLSTWFNLRQEKWAPVQGRCPAGQNVHWTLEQCSLSSTQCTDNYLLDNMAQGKPFFVGFGLATSQIEDTRRNGGM